MRCHEAGHLLACHAPCQSPLHAGHCPGSGQCHEQNQEWGPDLGVSGPVGRTDISKANTENELFPPLAQRKSPRAKLKTQSCQAGITRAAPKPCPHGLWGTRLSARHGRWYPSTAPADSMPLSLPLCPKPWVLRGSWPLVTPQTPGTLRTPPSAPSPPLASLPEHHQPHLRFQLPSRCSWPLYWVEAVPPNSCSCGTSESELHWKSGFCRCN